MPGDEYRCAGSNDGAAILVSWHQFFLQENCGMSLFFATWPATILALLINLM